MNLVASCDQTTVLPCRWRTCWRAAARPPLLPPAALQELGFSIVAYPLSLLGVSVRAMQQALLQLQAWPVQEIMQNVV